MKHVQLFEQFVNEEKAQRLTISADLWSGKTPEIVDRPRETQYVFYSGDVTGGKWLNFLAKPNVALIVIEQPKSGDKLYIKVGNGSEDDKGNKLYRRSIGDAIVVTVEELKADPAGLAKKVANIFIDSKKYFNMNFEPYDERAIFKMDKDLEKPALELIEFAIQQIK
jgi:hypothetical protein